MTVSAEGGVGDTLEWNQEMALSHLLTMEEHYKDLSVDKVPHAWCLVKHYLLACNHHVEEAIGHAERAGKSARPYREFRAKLRKLNAYPQPKFNLDDLIALRTEWRQIIGDPTLVSDCGNCSKDVTPEVLEELTEAAAVQAHKERRKRHVLNMEREYVDGLLSELSKKRGKSKPSFMIVDCGKDVDPSGRAVAAVGDGGRPFIAVCAGGANAHTIAHEAQHVWDHQDGRCDLKEANCPEDDAEKYALRGLSNYSGLNTHPLGGGSVKTTVKKAEILGIYGASLVAKGVEVWGLPYLDTSFPTGLLGQKASLWGKVVLGIVPPVLTIWKPNLFKKYELPVMVFSAHVASQLVDDIVAMMPAQAVRARSISPVREAAVVGGAGKVAAF